MHLLGITGYKDSGKDTTFHIIQKLLAPNKVVRLAFADALKEEVARITGFTIPALEVRKNQFRTLLQVWGTDFRRQMCGENYWIDCLAKKMRDLPPDVFMCCITDVRFLNEASFIRELGGRIWCINRGISNDTHQSEREIDKISCNLTLYNYTTIDELQKNIRKALNTLCHTPHPTP